MLCLLVAVLLLLLQLTASPLAGGQTHTSPPHDAWVGRVVSCGSGPMLASYEVVKMDNRSGRLFSECWLLCLFLLKVSAGPHDDARDGWVVSRGSGAHFPR